MSEEHERCEETKAFPAVLTRQDLKHLENKIDDVNTSVRSLSEELKKNNERHAQNDIWKAEINMRLAQGVERMNALAKDLDSRVKKETVLAYLAGAGLAGAGLLKLFGG